MNRPMDPSHGMILPSYRFRVGKSRFFQETARLIRKELPKDRDELCATWSNEKRTPGCFGYIGDNTTQLMNLVENSRNCLGFVGIVIQLKD